MAVAQSTFGDPDSRAGRFPDGGHPCIATISATPSGTASRRSSPIATTTARPGTPGRTIARRSTASSGTCTPAPPGPTRPSATAPGRRFTTASTAGAGTAPGPRSSTPCCSAWTEPASSSATCGASTPPSSAPRRPPPGREKNPRRPPALGGPRAPQMAEPPDHALGRSQGGFGTKTHLVCDSRGTLLAVGVTAGQRHESRAVEDVLSRARRPRQAGAARWPRAAAGDKGYSYRGVRGWLRRRHIGPVIPTRKDQPRDAGFDKATYRRRNIIERVVGWFKWCRALATRYDKLAVNYVALWIIANIQSLLRHYPEALGVQLSETT